MRRTGHLNERLRRADLLRVHGRVIRSVGPVLESSGPPAFVGEICRIETGRNEPPAPAEVVGFAEGRLFLMPWSSSVGIRPGAEVVGTGRSTHRRPRGRVRAPALPIQS